MRPKLGSTYRRRFWLGILLCFSLKTSAQEVPKLTNWVYQNLPAQHQNWMISQAQDHRMYFANSNGLLQFDGQSWQVFTLPEKQIVRAIGIDERGWIFAGAYGEFGYWDESAQGELTYRSLSELLPEDQIASEEIWHVEVGPDWVIFQSFTTCFLYNYETIQIIRPPNGGSLSLMKKIEGRYILLHQSSILRELHITRSGIEFHQVLESSDLQGRNLVGMLPLADDQWLFCTARNGMFVGSAHSPDLQKWQHDVVNELIRYEVNQVLKLQNGDLAFGTILNGLYLLSPEGSLRYHLNQANGLQNNTVLSLFQDFEGQLWIGLDNGVDMVDLHTPLKVYKDLEGEIGSIYAAAYFHGKLYVGSNHGLFCKEDDPRRPFSLIPGTQGQVWNLGQSKNGLMIGHNRGTFWWDGRHLSKLVDQSGGWCMAILPGKPPRMIQGTYGGLLLLEQTTTDWQTAIRYPRFYTSAKQMYLDIGTDTCLWVVNPYKGLHKIQLTQDFQEVKEVEEVKRADGLPTDFNLRLMGGQANYLLKAGEQFFDLRQPKLIPLTQLGPTQLGEELQYIWLGQQSDTFFIYPDRIELRDFAAKYEFDLRLIPRYEKIEQLTQGEYLFCLEDGYAIFRPDPTRRPASSRPPLFVTHVRSMANPEEVFWAGSKVDSPYQLILDAEQRHLRFQYCLPSFGSKVQFRHRLLGFDETWSDWSTQTVKEYTNLDPGQYRFEVEENQFSQRTFLVFSISPPWYQSSWALFAYFLLLVALMYAIYRIHKYLLDRQERRTAIEKERDFHRQLMQEKNMQLRQDIQRKSRELAQSTMSLIRKNETLVELKEELNGLKAQNGLPTHAVSRLNRRIDHILTDEKDRQAFELNFNQVHEDFFQKLKKDYPNLTAGDLRLAAFLRMGLSSKEIAPLFNISLRGVENKRYRLRKKMELAAQENLLDVLMGYGPE